MAELAEAFMDQVQDWIIAAKVNRFHLNERILKQHGGNPHVCISRVLSQLWNGNGDEWVTVYEINDATVKYGNDSAIEKTFLEMLAIENSFFSAISFSALRLDTG